MNYDEYLQTEGWGKIRRAALKYWDHKCALCFSENKLHVHHRTYCRLGSEQPNDVIVLCKKCHAKHHDALKLDEQLRGFWTRVFNELEAEGVTTWRQCPG